MKACTFGYSDSLEESSSLIYKSEEKVILSITTKDHLYNKVSIHLSPDEARKMAQDLIVHAYKIDSEALEKKEDG